MTIEDLGRMADEYAKEIAPDNKDEQTAISADSLGFLNKVMEKCCIVEKERVKDEYEKAKMDMVSKYHQGSMVVLQVLFPEIGKEVEG